MGSCSQREWFIHYIIFILLFNIEILLYFITVVLFVLYFAMIREWTRKNGYGGFCCCLQSWTLMEKHGIYYLIVIQTTLVYHVLRLYGNPCLWVMAGVVYWQLLWSRSYWDGLSYKTTLIISVSFFILVWKVLVILLLYQALCCFKIKKKFKCNREKIKK